MKKDRIFWGIFFIAGALFVLISQLGLLGDIGVFSLLLTVLFVGCLIQSIYHRSISGGLFSIAFLCIIYAKPLGLEAITPWPVLGAALLGSIGASFLYHPKRWYSHHHYVESEETVETIDQAQMQFNTSFGGSIKYVNSEDFQSTRLKCSFGSMKVYFDNAVIKGNEAVIDLDVSFAGVEIYLPKSWNVVNSAAVSFGGISEKNRNISTGSPTVRLLGKVSFGGVDIVYV